MTREEAIDYLKWERPINPYTLDRKNVQTAIDMAIEALKEQDEREKEKAFAEHLRERGY